MNAADRAQLAELFTALAAVLDVPIPSGYDDGDHIRLDLHSSRAAFMRGALMDAAKHTDNPHSLTALIKTAAHVVELYPVTYRPYQLDGVQA